MQGVRRALSVSKKTLGCMYCVCVCCYTSVLYGVEVEGFGEFGSGILCCVLLYLCLRNESKYLREGERGNYALARIPGARGYLSSNCSHLSWDSELWSMASHITASKQHMQHLVLFVAVVCCSRLTLVWSQETTTGICPAECGPPDDPMTCDELADQMPPGMASCELLSNQCDCTGCEICEPPPSTTPHTTVIPECYGICGEGTSARCSEVGTNDIHTECICLDH